MIEEIRKEVFAKGRPEKVDQYKKFFQCREGGYGEGDRFIGVTNPDLRALSKKYKGIHLDQCLILLKDDYHEIRMLALFIMVLKYSGRGSENKEKQSIFNAYLDHTNYINNWDLVDCSAYQIIGAHVYHTGGNELIKLAESEVMWENRISMVATWYFIRNKSLKIPLDIASMLVDHPHDLIHKAVGWMLRELGKRDICAELRFLELHQNTMPRTALRYAIEKFDEPLRQQFLKGTFIYKNYPFC